MQQKKHLWSLYLIITTIIMSLIVQVYFNYKNYQVNQHQFFNQIQSSLDTATDNYYVNLAKNQHPFLTNNLRSKVLVSNGNHTSWASASSNNDNLSITINSIGLGKDSAKTTIHKKTNKDRFPKRDSINNKKLIRFLKNSPTTIDSLLPDLKYFETDNNKSENIWIKTNSDSTEIELITGLKTIYFSMTNDSLDFKRLNLLFQKELDRKKISIPYQLNHFKNKNLISSNSDTNFSKNKIKILAKSTYLNKGEKIELLFPNQTKMHLKKGLFGILLSLLLAIAIIASLFYLLNIIKNQKQIAEIKNDFISNITHEFKTPITTISAAVEAISNFNQTGNKNKTEEYLDITSNQLQKLNLMVEKVLETSTLDSEKLLLHKESTDIIKLIEKCIVNQSEKISFNINTESVFLELDKFHFENVINNLLDNAIKYGKDAIAININEDVNEIEILVSDNGMIPKNQKDKIFDKFYRIPKGDTHDVKGFGIGLYYSKKIVEKHNGTLVLLPTKNTVFQIILPR